MLPQAEFASNAGNCVNCVIQSKRGTARKPFSPAAAWYLSFVFALVERKNERQKQIQYRSAEGSIV